MITVIKVQVSRKKVAGGNSGPEAISMSIASD